ncbi:hypothetical protein D9619_010235 [Psilocybe cf. subviscida]|uniref:Uncharacterized protein n=1 Tax=Psilocybe cf. subviscida TaxID=2480587 RepID=A0A8H5ASM9_9AGAR|nr:hypothetical protein D9619_010235 [Psilocybe cf. subviscida]
MAGFLRKKSKQEPLPKPAPTPVTYSKPGESTPLFARFATTAQVTADAPTQRIVSGPIPLVNGRKQSFTAGSGRAGAGNQTSAREADMARRRTHDQAQLSQASINFYAPATTTGQYKPRPVSVDKPLPPPVNNVPVSPTPNRRASAMRPPGPPPVFQQPNQTQGVRPRASVDFENKPLPRAGSVQAHIWQAEVRPPPPPNPKVMPPTRNGSANASQIGSSPLPPSVGGQRRPTPDMQHLPQGSAPQRSHPGQDYARDNGNARSSNRMSMGVAQHQMRVPVGTPMSDRVDLPPEFALFQVSRGEKVKPPLPEIPCPPESRNALSSASLQALLCQFSESISRPSSTAPSTLKTNGQVASSSGPRSSIYVESARNALKPQPSVPQFAPQRAVSPPLPPPPPPDMGASASRIAMTDLLPSPSFYKDFHQPHVLSSSNAPNATYINGADVIQQQAYPTPPAPVNNGSMLPSLLPSADFATNPYPAATRTAAPSRRPSASVLQSQQQPTPPAMGQLQSIPSQPVLRKAPSVQGSGAILKGKPKIFAAMEAQEYPPEPTPEKQYPSQPRNPSPNRHEQIPTHVAPPSQPKYQPDAQMQQHQVAPLLPPVELKTPRSRQDPLPSPFPNKAEADRRPVSVYRPSGSPPKPSLPAQLPAPQAESALRTPRPGPSRPLPSRPEEPLLGSPSNGHRARKLSKPRHHDNSSSSSHGHNRMTSNGTEPMQNGSPSKRPVTPPEAVVAVDEDTIRKAGLPLDDDPFAKPDGVVLLNPVTPPKEDEAQPLAAESGADASAEAEDEDFVPYDGPPLAATPEPAPAAPLTPESPPEKRSKSKKERKSKSRPREDVPIFPEAPPREPMTFTQFVATPELLASLLSYLSFYECQALKEVVLEQYLKTIGYQRWQWEDQEPLSLSLQDLSDYMRGVSTPTHEYSRVAAMYVHSLGVHPNHRDPSLGETVRNLTSSTRAYNRVLLRLRAQAEKEASVYASNSSPGASSPPSASSSSVARINNGIYQMPGRGFSSSRLSSRAPSPTQSMFNAGPNGGGGQPMPSPGSQIPGLTFRSPLFRLRRAPLLRVFVPSPEGDWLSDKSVLECEAECKKAGITQLMRSGDVVWDVAVGDEGNVGRLVYDGSYLLDLDYTYSPIGDLPKYLPTLAFPPSYFHRVIRTGASTANPIAHIDISPWGEEVAMNLQLLQDRVRTETPQGAYHNVVRWVHRSSFTIKAPRQARYTPSVRGGSSSSGRIPIPNTNNLFVDSGWYGTIIVETEGTNEALFDLQNRCGPGAFPPRPRGVNGVPSTVQTDNKLVYRILREKSRPGEIWIRAVSVKERMM